MFRKTPLKAQNEYVFQKFWGRHAPFAPPGYTYVVYPCTIFRPSERYLGVLINASLKDDEDIQRQMKSLYCAANKLRGTFGQCSSAVKSTLFPAYCMSMCACQLWSKYTQASMKRLRAAYKNAYRFMHYMPRNVSVRPHQVSHRVTTWMPR